MIDIDDIPPPAFRRQLAQTYVLRENDGSYTVQNFQLAVCEDNGTVLK